MRETFNWAPLVAVALAEEPRVNRTSFGDGYELRVAEGINSRPVKWDVRFIDTPQREVLAFLRARGGVEAFDWIDPFGAAGAYVCRTWNASHHGKWVYELAATFEQVFEA